MIVVTGGAGFIGSNLVKMLNSKGKSDLLVVDDLSEGNKFRNIADCNIADYIDKDEFRKMIASSHGLPEIELIFHQGACSDTTEQDGRYMMNNNYRYSRMLLQYCLERRIPFIYASSAAVYGTGAEFIEDVSREAPVNVYAYSKLLFDNYVRSVIPAAESQIVGLRYFNVYGPGEFHKGAMASVAYHLHNQLLENSTVKLFGAHEGYRAGEQSRDFVYIDDVTAINHWFMQHQQVSGIFNVGTGNARSFNDVAKAIIAFHERGEIEYVQFPNKLKGSYQSFTKADLSKLRGVDCRHEFMSLETGIKKYLEWLNAGSSA